MFVILVNDGAIHTLFQTLEDVKAEIVKMNSNLPINVIEMDDDADDEEDMIDLVQITVDDLVERLLDAGSIGQKIQVYADGLVEMGDDYVSMSVIDLT